MSGTPQPGSLEYWAATKGDAVAIVEGDRTLSWAQWNALSDSVAEGLARRGVGPGIKGFDAPAAMAVKAPSFTVDAWYLTPLALGLRFQSLGLWACFGGVAFVTAEAAAFEEGDDLLTEVDERGVSGLQVQVGGACRGRQAGQQHDCRGMARDSADDVVGSWH